MHFHVCQEFVNHFERLAEDPELPCQNLIAPPLLDGPKNRKKLTTK
jgi:hypothetical protein